MKADMTSQSLNDESRRTPEEEEDFVNADMLKLASKRTKIIAARHEAFTDRELRLLLHAAYVLGARDMADALQECGR